MKIIFKIAKTELQKLFYSPVAWLILVIFTFQAALLFSSNFRGWVMAQELGFELGFITNRVYGGLTGLFSFFSGYLYLYIPLLTMGIMSRDLSSGSIKLLYSSPVTNIQIIMGKYFSLMAFGLVLMAILTVFVLFGCATIVHVDYPQLLCGMLGIYLLICAYSSIGLFVSTLTSYMVVAAMGTLGIFALLSYVRMIGQDIEIVRDITYWLALSGRIDTFIRGMITSEDLLYFLIVIILFLALTLIKLQAGRQKMSWMITWGRFIGVFLGAMALGYFSSMPKLKVYADLTYTKSNTLTKGSQAVVSRIPDNITITTYTNMLGDNYYFTMPESYKEDVNRFQDYLRFNPSIKMKYVYFYHKADWPLLDQRYPGLSDDQRLDTLKRISEWDFKILPYKEIAEKVNLENEGFQTTRVIETPDGKKTFLRFFDDAEYFPGEAEISAAFKHLVTELPTVGFLTGQGERSINDRSDRGYYMFSRDKRFRYALINQGFDFENVTLDQPIAEKIRVLVIAEMKRNLTSPEQKNLDDFIARGGNMLILGDPGRQTLMNSITEPLGVKFLPGILAHDHGKWLPTSVEMEATSEGMKASRYLEDIGKFKNLMLMPGANALEIDSSNLKGFHAATWFTTIKDSSWLEFETTDFIDDTARFNPAAGELKKAYPTMVALNRKVNGREQKIIVAADADWLSGGELNLIRKQFTANGNLINALFYWFSDEEAPIDVRRSPSIDNSLRIRKDGWKIVQPIFKWVFPGILMIAGIVIWIRRRGR